MADLLSPRTVGALSGVTQGVLIPVLAPTGAGIAANTTIYGGAIVGLDGSGNMVNADAATCVTVTGIARKSYLNTTSATPPTSGVAGAISGEMLTGAYLCFQDATVTASTPYGTDLFVVDNQTVSTNDGAGLRLRAGYFVSIVGNQVACMFGVASPGARQPGSAAASSPSNKARAVATTIDAYTGSGTGVLTETTAASGIGAQDGVTLAVGDVLFLQEGTTNVTALDAGPWVVTALGSASVQWVLTRPDWYAHGSTIVPGSLIEIGGEGTAYTGAQFKTFVAKAQVVDTNAPKFWVGRFTQAVTLVTGFVTKTNVGIRSTTTSAISFQPTNFSGAASTLSYRTGVYASGGAATAAGVIGTGSVSITALVAAGTFNTSDVSSGLLTVQNW